MRIDIWTFELLITLMFGCVLFQEAKVSRKALYIFMMALLYGLLLEIINMLIFKPYYYSNDFHMKAFGVPLVIGMMWALILTSSIRISDALGVAPWAKPFSDGALCVLIDIAIDAVAIRLQCWTWTIPLNEGLFGVPASNFYAWICVAFCFSLAARYALCKRKIFWLFLIPLFSFVLLFLLFLSIKSIVIALHLESEQQKFMVFWVMWVVCFICMFFSRPSSTHNKTPISKIYTFSRILIYLYFLVVYLTLGLFSSIPYFLIISLSAFLVEILICYRVKSIAIT